MTLRRATPAAFLAAALAAAAAGASEEATRAHWSFDEAAGRLVRDAASGSDAAVEGYLERTDGVRGGALRFDGRTTRVRVPAGGVPPLEEGFTIEAWVALYAYPWNWTAIADQAGAARPRPSPEPPAEDLGALEPGLAGAVYGEPDLSDPQGTQALGRLDADWTGGAQTWSARWRGRLRGPVTGAVRIEAEADDAVRLEIDGQTLIDTWTGSTSRGTVELAEGRAHGLVLEYHQDRGPARLRVLWSWPGQPRVPIPAEALSHSPRDAALARWEVAPPRPAPPEWESRVFFGIDARGHLGLRLGTEAGTRECVAERPLPQLAWTHVAASVAGDGATRLYAGGAPVAECVLPGRLTPERGGELLLGRSLRRLGPTVSEREPSARALSPMVLDGVLDEVRIHDRALAPAAIAAAAAAAGAPPLERPRLPAGPAERASRFAAAWGRLRYTDAWEHPWRVGARPDLLIRFDRLPVRLLFWRGTGYSAAWITGNGLWMGDQSVERSGGTPRGTAEHMNDKQTRYSRVGLIEDGDARKVVQWRYALTDIGYGISRERETGTGEWAEERYTVYPDGVAVRHQVLWTDDLHHEWQETIVLHRPGDRPEDDTGIEALELANLAGETRLWSWAEGAPAAFDAPAEPNIQLTHLKSAYRPFIVFEPRPRIKPFRAAIRPEVSHFPWWNHWPVAQLPNDGRRAEGPGRPGHSSLSQSIEDSEVIHARADGAFEVMTLVGLTDQPIGSLVPLARSWLRPPEPEIAGDAFASLGYERRERAFVLERRDGGAAALELHLPASATSPLVNPAFVLRGWGEAGAALRVDGERVPRGSDFRYAHRRDLSGRVDLVVWIALERAEPVSLRLEPAGGPR